MSRFYLIHLTGTGSAGAVSIYLTSDGLIGGRRCKTTIDGAAALLNPQSGNTTVAASGSPFTEKPLIAGRGRPFAIKIDWIPTARYLTLKDLIDNSATNNLDITITAAGEPGSINVNAIPNFAPGPYDLESFRDDTIKGLELRFITTAVN